MSTKLTKSNWGPLQTRILKYKHRGWTNKRVAEKLGCSEGTIRRAVASPYFKERLQALEDKVVELYTEKVVEKDILSKARQLLEEEALAAAHKIIALSHEGNSRQRLQYDAAKEILHIAGLKPIEKQEVDVNQRSYTPEEIESASRTLREMEEIAGRLSNADSRFIMKSEEELDEQQDQSQIQPASEDRQEISE